MKKIVITNQSLSLMGILKSATKSIFLAGFFLLSFGVIASAQNYVSPEEAVVLLKQKIDETALSQKINSTSRELSDESRSAAFYELMVINVEKTNSVVLAIEETFTKPNYQGKRRSAAQIAEAKIKTLLTR